MKTLSFVSLALFISHLMPVLAVKSQKCGSVTVPKSLIEEKIDESVGEQPVEIGRMHSVNEKRGDVVFEYTEPKKDGLMVEVSLSYSMKGEIMSITGKINGQTVRCVEKKRWF
ncbi:BgTH12-06849 [Blumeria graminis f. sp. triticale]|uniref:BgTH12-06849 n=1 Tax=Blumeria graminis f. sp. triticale TaxID=1689686 RepID=A0A9W4D8U1_BLUGR|nr:BgTH12-06849 [Blumeria graminis f. sp. triticale]